MAFKLRTNSGRPLHPEVPALQDQFLKGEIDRRDFLRTAAWLGVALGSARAFTQAIAPTPAQAQAAETPKRGGTIRQATVVQEITDPHAVTWTSATTLTRNSVEFLTHVDEDNITHPYLAASWDPSPDLKTWRFKLQPNVKWSNGDAFTAADVVANIKRWVAPESKSANKTTFKIITDMIVHNPLEFTLVLDRAVLAIPEMFYAYTCGIMHPKFDEQGGNWSKNPIGTGPYQMTEYAVGQRATFKAKPDYWGKKPYLDELRFIDLGAESTAQIAALAAGQVDLVATINTSDIDVVKRLPNVDLLQVNCAQTICMRMQVDQKPYDDIRVRHALVLAADNAKMLEIAYRGLGVVGENHHVAPFQPEYAKLPPVKRDVAKAKALLAEAGYKDGVDMELVLGNTQGRWEQDTAQILQQNAAEAGIRIKLKVLPSTEFWPIWNKVPFGLTFWAHRPLAVMTLDLAYRGGAAWNESKFASKDFDVALDKAMGIVDPKARAVAMMDVQRLLQEAAVMVQPYWSDRFGASSKKVRGFRLHPATYTSLFNTWLV